MKISILSFYLFLCSLGYAYEDFYYDYACQIVKNDAVAIIACNRPDYMAQLIQSLEMTPESQSLPFFFFLDYRDEVTAQENQKLIQNSSLAFKRIIQRKYNYGCPKNHIDAKRFLFDHCHFERIVVIEEDVVVTKEYFQLLFALDQWAHENYSNIGTVQLWNSSLLSKEEKSRALSLVREVAPLWSLVTYCMRKDVWNVIAPDLFKYESYIDPLLHNPSYQIARSKPAKGPTAAACLNWIQKRALLIDQKQSLENFANKNQVWLSRWDQANWNKLFAISQDKVNSYFLWLHGFVRLQTVVNRVNHIGLEGISGTYNKNTVLDLFEEDKEIPNFIPSFEPLVLN